MRACVFLPCTARKLCGFRSAVLNSDEEDSAESSTDDESMEEKPAETPDDKYRIHSIKHTCPNKRTPPFFSRFNDDRSLRKSKVSHTVVPRYYAPRYYTDSVVDPDFLPPGENAKWACLNLLRMALTILNIRRTMSMNQY